MKAELEKYENVVMYPNIKMSTVERLFWECDFYFDINHEGEIINALRKAFIHNQLIFAFNETAHGLHYTAIENRFDSRDYKKLAERVKSLLSNKEKLNVAIHSQQSYALTAKAEDYRF